jgi:putative oxidoreductase
MTTLSPAASRPAGSGNSGFATSLALLVLRGALAWIFIFQGAGKLFGAFGGPGIDHFAQYLQGMPGFLSPTGWAILAGSGELGGGVLLALGLFTRLAALDLIVVMLVAIVQVTGHNGFGLAHGGYEYNMLIIGVNSALVLTGGGLVSVDAMLFKKGLWARGPQPLGTPPADHG